MFASQFVLVTREIAGIWQWPSNLGDFRGLSRLFIGDEIEVIREVIRESGESWRNLRKVVGEGVGSSDQKTKNHVARGRWAGEKKVQERMRMKSRICRRPTVSPSLSSWRKAGSWEEPAPRKLSRTPCHDFPGAASWCSCTCPGHAAPHCISPIPALGLLCIISPRDVFPRCISPVPPPASQRSLVQQNRMKDAQSSSRPHLRPEKERNPLTFYSDHGP